MHKFLLFSLFSLTVNLHASSLNSSSLTSFQHSKTSSPEMQILTDQFNGLSLASHKSRKKTGEVKMVDEGRTLKENISPRVRCLKLKKNHSETNKPALRPLPGMTWKETLKLLNSSSISRRRLMKENRRKDAPGIQKKSTKGREKPQIFKSALKRYALNQVYKPAPKA